MSNNKFPTREDIDHLKRLARLADLILMAAKRNLEHPDEMIRDQGRQGLADAQDKLLALAKRAEIAGSEIALCRREYERSQPPSTGAHPGGGS